jgi:CRISPR/Cas system-associated endoribonuclease Cas2
MSYLPYVTLVGWETRNWRHRDRALIWCKDYGFAPITKHVFVGEIYAKERTEMRKKFESLFTKKTEKFFFATMCKSCFTEHMTGMPIQEKLRTLDHFELVQMPKNP